MKADGPQSTSGSKTRILVVDDHQVVREGIVGLINRQRDLVCCADVGTAAEAEQAAATHSPDLAIIDLRLGNSDGLELIKTFSARFPRLLMVVLSQLDQGTFAQRALRAGARGYVMKEQAAADLLKAIRTVLGGQVYLSQGLAAMFLRAMVGRPELAARKGIELLSDRELHILPLIGVGMASKEIAAQLQVSPKTVDSHRENIKRKLDLLTSSDLTRFAISWANRPSVLAENDVDRDSDDDDDEADPAPARARKKEI